MKHYSRKNISSLFVMFVSSLMSMQALALGLGDAQVRSYLNQPLLAQIELVSTSGEELGSVTAGMASAEDFEMMGLSLGISVPLHFEVYFDANEAYILVSSRLAITDPVVQLVLEVRWSGGRMLREYTLFIDPPTFASKAPQPMIFTQPSQAAPELTELEPRQIAKENYPDPANLDVVETIKPPARPEPIVREDVASGIIATESEEGSAKNSARKTATVPAEPISHGPVVPEPAPAGPVVLDPAVHGMAIQEPPEGVNTTVRVEKGNTLWAIASANNSLDSFSINQAMLAIQRLNPEAFAANNINSLKQGAILRMPTSSETGKLTKRQAMLEAIRQEQGYFAMRAGRQPENLPAISELSAQQLTGNEPQEPLEHEQDTDAAESRLQLVPPSQKADQNNSGNGSEESAVGAVSSQEVEEVLARTEEELVNAKQENAYLNQRIQELESQISSSESDGGLTDNTLAEMEQSLREDRLADDGNDLQAQVSEKDPAPWYLTNAWWVGGLLVLLVAIVVWVLRRLGSGSEPDTAHRETVGDIRSEAEDILHTLDETTQLEPAQDEPSAFKPKVIPINSEQAVELDIEDPEVKLDMARAYLSMGDKDAARGMLNDVLESGNEIQINEARQMMEEL
jgi:pilus assembly protein FimV